MNIFYSFETINWGRVSLVVSVVTAFWLGLITIIPERYHHVGTVILAAMTSAISILIRGGQPTITEVVKDAVVEKIKDIPEPPPPAI